MKRTLAMLALAVALHGLAGCGEQADENVAADQNNGQQVDGNVLSNDLPATGSPAPIDEAGASAAPAVADEPQAREERPAAGNWSSGPDEARRPPPPAPRPPPEPDPHAGHDMSNMSNMSNMSHD